MKQTPILVKFTFILIAALVATQRSAHAQDGPHCGTERPDRSLILSRNLHDEQVHLNRAGNIPIVAHVLEINGVPIVTDAVIDEWMESALFHFKFLPAPFEIVRFERFSGQALAEMTVQESADLLRKYNERDPHQIHIIFTSTQPRMCGVTSLPPSSSQGIVVSVDGCDVASTLAHELGHFFMLQHTHEGAGTGESEQVSRDLDNCSYKGDGLCYTPADPTLSLNNVDQACNYFGNARDEAGLFYTPDTHNIMSYTRDTCANRFVDEQRTLMEQVYEYLVLDPHSRQTNDVSLAVRITEIFPNPVRAGEPVTIHYKSNGSMRVQAFVLDEASQHVWSKSDIPALDGIGEVLWTPNENLPQGAYTVVVTTVKGRKANGKKILLFK